MSAEALSASPPATDGSLELGLFLDGLHCAGCVNRVERALRGVPGVEEAAVNYTSHRALIRLDPRQTGADALIGVVRGEGFDATPFDPEALAGARGRDERGALIRLLVAAFLAGNVMWLSVALYAGGYEGMEPDVRFVLRWLALGLTVPAITWCALPFWRGAWSGLRRGSLNVDVPILLGFLTAFGVGVAGTWAEADHLYMDSAAMIVFLVLLGRTLERGARGRARAAVDRLTALVPRKAWLVTKDGLVERAVDELRVGDRVRVPAGATVPADGTLVSEAGELDESPFTGESRPVLHEKGERVIGGSSCVGVEIDVELVALPGQGTLARLAALLERAQAERPAVQRLADRVAGVFAPAVLTVAAATALFWTLRGAPALDIALATAAVLIVACPCALGLATPAAITAAIGRAASLGILVKSGAALERCAHVDAVILDKTGTWSEGRFAVRQVVPAEGVDETALLETAARVEGASTHPLAVALREHAEQIGGSAPEAQEDLERRTHPGRGIEARDGAVTLRAGSLGWLGEQGVKIPEALAAEASRLARRGLSLVAVARDHEALGVIALWDPPRQDAAATSARLAALGVRAFLVTGDHRDAAVLATEDASLAGLFASQSPEQKVERVRALRDEGRQVLVAGDGVNDAAALGVADVGLAMHRGSDVTLEAADLVVRSSQLGAVADAVELSRATLARIRENLGFAVLYNLAAVPLAMAGVLGPLQAAIAMGASSVIVTLNALRLLRWRRS